MTNAKNAPKTRRKWWFRALKKIMKVRYKKPEFVHIGEPIQPGSLVLSNHEGTDSPMTLEIYYDAPLRFWGAGEMNSGLKEMYKYQTRVYYHEKKGWNIHLARLFCLIASPLTNLFYKGLNLISTWKDGRLLKTIKESITTLSNGESVVIFPEVSDNGYLKELEGLHLGFITLADTALKKGMDLPIVLSYFNKHNKKYVIDKAIPYSKLKNQFENKDELCAHLLARINQLGDISYTE